MQVSILKIINGEDGNKAGHTAIVSIVDAIIHPSVQAEYTWTGKTNAPHVKKRSLSVFNQIQSVIHTVCRLADSSYTQKNCTHDLVYKVLKYAQSRW